MRVIEERYRIHYLSKDSTVDKDRNIFKQWEENRITTLKAAALIRINNKLEKNVSVEQFLANAAWLGYER